MEGFYDDSFYAEVVAPDLFDEFCVVDALDPDAAGAGCAGGGILEGDRTGAGDLSTGFLGGPGGGYKVDRFAFEEEAGAEGEGFDASVAVFETDDAHSADGF